MMTPCPVRDFLLSNQNISDERQIDWAKAKRMLKNMRIKTLHTRREFEIIGISDMSCYDQCFTMKVRDGGENETVDITVYDYFVQNRIELTWSAYVPCLVVGEPERPRYLPVELCYLMPFHRHTKAVKNNRYDDDPLLKSCGISIDKQLTEVEGRVLAPPKIKFEEGIIGTPQLTDSIVIPDKVEFYGQNINSSPLNGVITSIENSFSLVATGKISNLQQ